MLTDIRLRSQQLANQDFSDPATLVSWMGAMQAQNCNMAKWAVGIRLKSPGLRKVEESLRKGEILRTHVMRPTWHLVAAEDIRWMVQLSAGRIKSANRSLSKIHELEMSEKLYVRSNDLMVRMLEGGNSLTREEIGKGLERAGVAVDNSRMTRFMMCAEAEGIVCSGVEKNGKQTYALLDERVPRMPGLSKEEALTSLATAYFRSHSPASLQDFIWWSGLSASEARQAVGALGKELSVEYFSGQKLFVHDSCDLSTQTDNVLHLLPAYDEYLIGYKDRTAVMEREHYPNAFNNWGIFYPVVLQNGRITGNWSKTVKRRTVTLDASFFAGKTDSPEELVKAKDRYLVFIS